MIVLDIADKAHPKMVSRWDYHPPNVGFTHTVVPFFERNLLDRQRRMHPQRRRRLAQTGMDRRQPRRGKPGADRDLPDAAGRNVSPAAAGASARIICGKTCPRKAATNPTRSSSAPSSTAACAPTTSATRTSRRSSRYFVPAPSTAPRPAPASSTTCSSTTAASSSPSTAMSAGSTCWRWISRILRDAACGRSSG